METTLGYDWTGPPELEGRLYGIDEFHLHPRNVRKGNVDVLMKALVRFGQMYPIVVQKSSGDIVKGNHTWKAANRLGWKRIAALVIDIDDDTAYQYLLADNRASDLAEYDKEALTKSLQELADKGQLGSTLWTADDLDDMQAALGTLETLAQEFTGDFSDDPAVRAQRQERELTRIATKMREVPIVITVDQHRVFMENLEVLRREYHTGGTIETILLAVQKEADLFRRETPEVAPIVAQPDPTPPPPSSGQQGALQAGTGGEEAPPAPAQSSDGYSIDQKGNLAPEAKQAIWSQVGDKLVLTLQALRTDPVKRSVIFGIIEAVTPNEPVAPLGKAERRRAGTALREAIIQQQDKQEFTMAELKHLCEQLYHRPISPIQ